MRNRRVNFQGFQRNVALFLRRHVLQRPHIVQAVGKFDDDNANVVAHRQQHFANVFRLKFLFGCQRHFAEFCNAVHKRGNVVAEVRANIVECNVGVFHCVV